MENGLVSMAQQFSGLPMPALIGGPLKAAAEANSMMAVTFTTFMLDTCFAQVQVAEQPKVVGTLADLTADPIIPGIVGSPLIPAHVQYQPVMITMSLTRAVLTPGLPAAPAVAAVAAVAADPTTTPPTPPTPAISAVAGVVAQTAQPAIIQNFTTAFNLPLLTIMPLNSLAVETVDINFVMEVKSSFSDEQSKESVKQVKGESSFEAKVGYGPFSASIKGSASYDRKDTSSSKQHYEKSNSATYTVGVHAGQLPLPAGVPVILEAFASAIQPITLT
jgi:hypothetical protein